MAFSFCHTFLCNRALWTSYVWNWPRICWGRGYQKCQTYLLINNTYTNQPFPSCCYQTHSSQRFPILSFSFHSSSLLEHIFARPFQSWQIGPWYRTETSRNFALVFSQSVCLLKPAICQTVDIFPRGRKGMPVLRYLWKIQVPELQDTSHKRISIYPILIS